MTLRLLMLGLVLLFLPRRDAIANPLDEVLNSPTLRGVGNQAKQQRSLIERNENPQTPWFDKRSSYGKIFIDHDEILKIREWLFSRLSDVKFIRKNAPVLQETHIQLKLYGESSISRRGYHFEVLIPHPAYFDLLDVRMIKEFEDARPKAKDMEIEEEIHVNGYAGTMYYGISTGCSLVFPLARRSLLRLYTERCERFSEQLREMQGIAENIDFHRFNRQLGESAPSQD